MAISISDSYLKEGSGDVTSFIFYFPRDHHDMLIGGIPAGSVSNSFFIIFNISWYDSFVKDVLLVVRGVMTPFQSLLASYLRMIKSWNSDVMKYHINIYVVRTHTIFCEKSQGDKTVPQWRDLTRPEWQNA